MLRIRRKMTRKRPNEAKWPKINKNGSKQQKTSHALERLNAEQLEAEFERLSRHFAESEASRVDLAVRGLHAAVFVEIGVDGAQAVQKVANPVRHQVARGLHQNVLHPQEVRQQRVLARAEARAVAHKAGLVHLRIGKTDLFTQRRDSGVAIQQITGRVALEGEHFLEGEAVVLGADGGQVSVLDGRNPNHLRNMIHLRRIVRLFALQDHLFGLLFSLIQQLHQLHRLTRTRLQALPVGAQHHAEAHVLRLARGGPF